MTGRIEPLPEARFGAEVTGTGLAALDDAEFARIARALADRVLLVFRGQEALRPEDQIAFSLRFGALLPPQLREHTLDGFPSIGILSNDKKEDGTPMGLASSGRNWHTDVQFDRTPPDATFLVSRALPDEGGDTLFANMFLALEALPAETRARIESLRAVHSRTRSWPILFPDRPPLPLEEAARYPDVSHPLVPGGASARWRGPSAHLGTGSTHFPALQGQGRGRCRDRQAVERPQRWRGRKDPQ